MNPFSWTAVPFLTAYVLLGLVFVGLIVALRRRLGEAPTDGVHHVLDPLALAYLSGGLERAADTVLVGFLASGAAAPDEKKRRVLFESIRAPLPDMLEPFRDSVPRMATRSEFHDAIGARLSAVHADLVRLGLAPGRVDIRRIGWITAGLAGLMILLGSIRIALAIPQERPYGYLLLLLAVVIVTCIVMLRLPPTRTRAGTAALKRSCFQHARAARAPLNVELALAFALTGPAVLNGTPFAALVAPPGGGSGGGGGGGGCGGGGCGGGG